MKKIKPKYDYSLLKEDYPDRVPKANDYIRVICSIHGEFKISYYYHKNGRGCKYCNGYWTLDTCKQEALKYKKRSEWKKKSNRSYQSAVRNGWLDECSKHMFRMQMPLGYWTLDTCKKEAKKYISRSEWAKKSGGSYNTALKNGWVDICSKHMKLIYKPSGYWTLDICKQEALKYKTKAEWAKKSGGSYQAAKRNGWVDICSKHMKSGYKLRWKK